MVPRLKNNPAQAAARFAASIREIARLTGYNPALVTRMEVGAVLKIVAGRTKVAAPNQLPFRARLRAEKQAFGYTNIKKNPFGISINTGRRGSVPGRVWFRHPSKKFQIMGEVSDTGDFSPANIHWKASVWNPARQGITEYILQLRRAFPAVESSAGLARQSWVQMADALGIRLEDIPGAGASAAAIAKARAAIASNGQHYLNGSAQEQYEGTAKYLARLINSLPYGVKINFEPMMASILAARARRYMAAHEKGVFDSVDTMRRRYPWIKLVGAPPALSAA